MRRRQARTPLRTSAPRLRLRCGEGRRGRFYWGEQQGTLCIDEANHSSFFKFVRPHMSTRDHATRRGAVLSVGIPGNTINMGANSEFDHPRTESQTFIAIVAVVRVLLQLLDFRYFHGDGEGPTIHLSHFPEAFSFSRRLVLCSPHRFYSLFAGSRPPRTVLRCKGAYQQVGGCGVETAGRLACRRRRTHCLVRGSRRRRRG